MANLLTGGVVQRAARTWRQVIPSPKPQVPERLAGSIDLAIWAVGFGLVAGLLELAVLLAQRAISGTVTQDSLNLSHHFRWMVPAANLAIFAVLGLVLAPVVRLLPRFGSRLALVVLGFLASLAPLLALTGLHPVVSLVLAAGLGSRAAGLLECRPRRFRGLVRTSLPLLLAVVGVLGALEFRRVASQESRALASLPEAPRGAPNVLLIVLDTVRAENLSLYGYGRDTTPNLATLAGRGVRFDQARSTAPWTLPSHASMFAGRWPHELFTATLQPLDRTYPVLAEYLASRGYRTAGFVGNTHFCNEQFGVGRGFSHYEDFPGRRKVSLTETLRSARLGRRLVRLADHIGLVDADMHRPRITAAQINGNALTWLFGAKEGRAAERPYFLFLNYIDAHAPYYPPSGFASRYGDPGAIRAAYDILEPIANKSAQEFTPVDLRRLMGLVEPLRNAYDDCIAYLDEELGTLLGTLDQRGALRNTLVIVTADHGELIGEHELFGHVTSLYRPLLHVPLVVVPPAGLGVPTGQAVGAPVSLRDLPATVVDLLGLDPASTLPPFPGRSLARYWRRDRGPDPQITDPVLSEVDLQTKLVPDQWRSPAARGPMQALLARESVYIHNGDGREELFDLENDPAESHDRSNSPGSYPLLERFRRDLEAIVRRTPRR
jgi:arylsulfatase A-like enzyme